MLEKIPQTTWYQCPTFDYFYNMYTLVFAYGRVVILLARAHGWSEHRHMITHFTCTKKDIFIYKVCTPIRD